MADEVRSTTLGSYVEKTGLSVDITSFGIYVESTEFNNEVDVTSFGSYVEFDGHSVNVSDYGVYVESYIPDLKFAVILGGKKLEGITTIKVNFDVSFATTNTLNGVVYKTPIIPDFIVTVSGVWSKKLVNYLGDLSNQSQRSLIIIVTDLQNNVVVLTNQLSFVQKFDTNINIDNVITFMIEIVGSGVLQSS